MVEKNLISSNGFNFMIYQSISKNAFMKCLFWKHYEKKVFEKKKKFVMYKRFL